MLVPHTIEEPANVTDSIFAVVNETDVTPEPEIVIKKGLEFKDGMNVLGMEMVSLQYLQKQIRYCFQEKHPYLMLICIVYSLKVLIHY